MYLVPDAGDIMAPRIPRDPQGRLLVPATPARVNDLVYFCDIVTEGSAAALAPFGPVRGTSGAYDSDNWGGTFVAGTTEAGGRRETGERGPEVGVAEYDVLLSAKVSWDSNDNTRSSPDA